MFVKEIYDYDEFSGELDLIVSDGKNNLLCYCIGGDVKLFSTIREITTFLVQNIMRAESAKSLIQKCDDYYAYHLQGKVVEKISPIVCVGNINIILDTPLAKDIKIGDYIEFDVKRLDCRI